MEVEKNVTLMSIINQVGTSFFNFFAKNSITSDCIALLGYSLCLLNSGINPIKILRLGKNLQNWENTGLFLIGKQPVFCFKIGKIK